jgi:aryl-alcohol dehydrogenase-like predicted oxidoreductase
MRVSRRRFLRAGLFATGAAAVATACGRTGVKTAEEPATMPLRSLGRTGLQVSEIGFGGFPIDDPDVLRYALDHGIRYVDTSNCYRGGKSEETIGAGLEGRRDKVVLTTKWCPHHLGKEPKKQAFLDQLDTSLKRLRTDHVDVLLNHEIGRNSDGIGVGRLDNPEMLEAWEVVKKAGKARFLGASGHDPDLMDIMHHAVDKGPFDVVLCRYSFLDFPQQNQLIASAKQKGVGFIAMKTLAGAKGADLDRFRDRHVTFKQAALKWVLSNSGVSNLIISITNTRQVDEYVAAAGQPLTAGDHEILDDYARTFSTQVCRFDGACLPACPEDVRIADILRFSMYYHEYGQQERAVESYARLVAAERAAHCLHCSGFCEQACSYELPVKTLMLKADRALARKTWGSIES